MTLAWSRIMLTWWFMQGSGGSCHSSFLSCALRFPALGNEASAVATCAGVMEWWWHVWARQAGDLGLGNWSRFRHKSWYHEVFFLPCQFVEAPTQPENTESGGKVHREICKSTQNFESVWHFRFRWWTLRARREGQRKANAGTIHEGATKCQNPLSFSKCSHREEHVAQVDVSAFLHSKKVILQMPQVPCSKLQVMFLSSQDSLRSGKHLRVWVEMFSLLIWSIILQTELSFL